MRHRWPDDEIEFKPLVLDVEDRNCRICSAFMHVCDHRKRHVCAHMLCHFVLPYSNFNWATPCRSESMAALFEGFQAGEAPVP